MYGNAQKVYIVSGVRTPIASFRGSYSSISSVELAAQASKVALERSGISPSDIEETFVGTVLTANNGQNIARQVSIAVGIPKTAQSVTINKVCSSSMKAIALAFISIKSGYRTRTLVAGCENMSQVPFYIPRGEIPYGGLKIIDGISKDGLEDAVLNTSMGLCAEKSVKDYNITRHSQDSYAIESYKKASASWKNGDFVDEVTPVRIKQRRGTDIIISEDEEYKKLVETKVPSLSPAFLKDGTGTITAANASSLNDGGVAAIVVAGNMLPTGITPLAEFVSFEEAGGEPVDFTVAPVWAVKNLLTRENLRIEDIALWEVNEAFSATVLIFIQELGIDPKRVNVKGGAVALGHPLGMSGLRIVLSLAYSLAPDQYGIAAICNGGGEAMAVLLKKPK